MKKSLILLLTIMVSLSFGLSVKAAVHPETPPVVGEDAPTTDFYSHWQPGNFGACRFGDEGIIMALTSGFGQRAGFRTVYDATDFEAKIDLSYMEPKTVAMFFFGPYGSYISNNGAVLSIEFLRHSTVENKYLMSVQVGSGIHHVAMDEFIVAEQGEWDDDAAWKGYHLIAENNIIEFSIKEVDENVIFTVNGQIFTVASQKFYADFDNKKAVPLNVGALNMDNTIQTVVAHYFNDSTRKVYYEENGIYYSFKANLAALEAELEKDLSVEENVLAAQEIAALMDIELLMTHDKNFYHERYQTAKNKLDLAIKELGGDIVLNTLEGQIVTLEDKIELITDYDTAIVANTQLATVNNTLDGVDSSEFSAEQLERLEALRGRVTTAEATVYEKIDNLVVSSIEAYEQAVNSLTSVAEINQALSLRGSISTNLLNLLKEETKTAYLSRIATAQTIFTNATNTLDGWRLGSGTHVIKTENTIDATFLGGALGGGNGIFYEKEKFDIRDFQMTIDFVSITRETGGWLTFGIMEKAEIFSNADDNTVQDNKGLFFLIIPEAGQKARVEVYLLSLYSNRFFDAKLVTNMTINVKEPINIKFGTEMRTIAGVTDEYFTISFDDQVYTETITVRSLRTALSDYQGYLNIAGSGGTTSNFNSVSISKINGKSVNEASLVKEYAPEPFAPTTTFSYQIGSKSDLNIEFYNHGLDFSVKLNGNVVDSANYTYENNNLKIKKEFLNELEAKTNTLVITTAAGSLEINLTTTTTQQPPQENDTPEASNNLRLIIGLSVVGVAVIGLGVVGFFIYKKKKA